MVWKYVHDCDNKELHHGDGTVTERESLEVISQERELRCVGAKIGEAGLRNLSVHGWIERVCSRHW